MGEPPTATLAESPSQRRTLLIGGLVFALVFPTLMAWLYFVVLAGSPGDGQPSLGMRLGYGLGKSVQFLFPLLWVRLLDGRWPRPSLPSFRGLRVGLVFGLVVGGAILGLFFLLRQTPLLRHTPEMIQAKLDQAGLASVGGFLALAVYISVLHSLAEEYYWRWFVFGRLEGLLPVGWAIAVASLGFMAHHVVVLGVYMPGRFWTAALPLSLGIAVGGAVWAWLYHLSRSVYSPWVSHMLIDGALMTIGYWMLFGDC